MNTYLNVDDNAKLVKLFNISKESNEIFPIHPMDFPLRASVLP